MIEIKVDDREMQALFKRLSARISDMSPAMRNISSILLDAVEENFAQEGRPRWQPLAAATIKERLKAGHWPGKMLQRSAGGLASSISPGWGKDFARAGTVKKYAAIHQFGGQAGRGRKVTIPARPYLVVQDEDMAEIKAVIRDHIMAAEKGG